jgi:fructose-1-phosphate kinase PfkB-like protein
MDISKRILDVCRTLDGNTIELTEAATTKISDESLIALYVLTKYKIKPNIKELKQLTNLEYIVSGKITKAGQEILKKPENIKKLKDIMS